jgi:hypothetical protein
MVFAQVFHAKRQRLAIQGLRFVVAATQSEQQPEVVQAQGY